VPWYVHAESQAKERYSYDQKLTSLQQSRYTVLTSSLFCSFCNIHDVYTRPVNQCQKCSSTIISHRPASYQSRKSDLPMMSRTPTRIPIAWPGLGQECSRSTAIKHEFSLEHLHTFTAKRNAMRLMRSLVVQFHSDICNCCLEMHSSVHSVPSRSTCLSKGGFPLSPITTGTIYTFCSKFACFGER